MKISPFLKSPEILARANTALKNLTGFIGGSQLAFVKSLLRGEEGQHFMEQLEALAAIVATIPETYATDGQGDEAICHLHYFGGSYDGYLIEKDAGDEHDSPEDFQSQAFGFVRWSHMSEEACTGYISLPELFRSNIELDFRFTPISLGEVKRKFAPTSKNSPTAAAQSDAFADF